MPNLKSFILFCNPYLDKNRDKFYLQFIEKLLKMKYEQIYLTFNSSYQIKDQQYYSIDELKNIYPDFECINPNEIKIAKIKVDN